MRGENHIGKSLRALFYPASHFLRFFQLVIRDRPFERTITLQKDSSGHVGFNYKNGKITHLLKDSSAARNGLLIDHQICEVGGQSVVGMKVILNNVFL